MLGKILKYEFKSTARIFLLMYAALLVLAAINAGLIAFNNSQINLGDVLETVVYPIIMSISMILYVVMAGAVLAVTIIVIIVRFYRLLGNEGYLWFTLPVTATQHLFGKLIVALIWSLASAVMLFVSIALLALPTGFFDVIEQFSNLWAQLASQGFSPGFWLVCVTALLLMSLLNSVLMFFAAMAIGPNITKSRLGGSVIAFIILYIGVQIIDTIGLVAMVVPLNTQATIISDSTMSLDLPLMSQAVNSAVTTLTVGNTLIMGALSVVFFIIARHFMTKKLNLA